MAEMMPIYYWSCWQNICWFDYLIIYKPYLNNSKYMMKIYSHGPVVLFFVAIMLQLLANQPLQWRHKKCDGVPNDQLHNCLLNHLFRHGWKKTSKLYVTGLCEGYSPMNSPHKGPITWKIFSFDDVFMQRHNLQENYGTCYYSGNKKVSQQ